VHARANAAVAGKAHTCLTRVIVTIKADITCRHVATMQH
jgi:hypothetical protein